MSDVFFRWNNRVHKDWQHRRTEMGSCNWKNVMLKVTKELKLKPARKFRFLWVGHLRDGTMLCIEARPDRVPKKKKKVSTIEWFIFHADWFRCIHSCSRAAETLKC
jgi:hypothetical protein